MTVQGILRVLGRPAVQARPITKGLLKGLIAYVDRNGLGLYGKVGVSLVNWREAWRELPSNLILSRFSALQRVRREDVSLDYESKVVAWPSSFIRTTSSIQAMWGICRRSTVTALTGSLSATWPCCELTSLGLCSLTREQARPQPPSMRAVDSRRDC